MERTRRADVAAAASPRPICTEYLARGAHRRIAASPRLVRSQIKSVHTPRLERHRPRGVELRAVERSVPTGSIIFSHKTLNARATPAHGSPR